MCVLLKNGLLPALVIAMVCMFVPRSQAAMKFLPEFANSEFGWPGNIIPERPVSPSGNCSSYDLSNCPANGVCQKCPFGEKYNITGCKTGYTKTGSTCVAQSCDKINTDYLSSVANNKVCSIVPNIGLTCYNGCRDISCAAYTLTACPANANCTPCPDCNTTASTKGTCGVAWQKVASCKTATQKVNSNATACVDKDDSCPSGLLKDCGANGIDSSKPTQKTEMGSTCYVCKAPATCSDYVKVNFPSYTAITSTESLQHALIDNKTNLVVTKDFNLSADIDLSGKTVMGANEIATASPLCAKNPKIIVQGKTQIKTSNNTEFKKLTFVNKIETKDGCYNSEMISGGGTLRDVELTFTPEKQISSSGGEYYTSNFNNPHMAIRGIANFYNVKSTGMGNLSVEEGSTLNVKGKLEGNRTNTTDGSWGFINSTGNKPTINVESTGSITYNGTGSLFNYDGGVGDCELNGSSISRDGTININGTIVHNVPETQYGQDTIDWNTGTVNINVPISLNGRLSAKNAEINAPITIDAHNYTAIYSTSYGSDSTNIIKINAPVKIINATVFDKDLDYPYANNGTLDVDSIYINSDLIFDKRVEFMPVISRGTVTFGPKANVKGPARWMLSNNSSVRRSISYSSGAKLEIGGVCKQANSSGTYDPDVKATIIWKTPQSPFTGTCSSSSGTNDCSASIRPTSRICNGVKYRCGSGSATIDCGLVMDGIGGCVPLDTCK